MTATFYELGTPGAYVDWFSHAPVTLPASGTIDIPAHGYRVLVH